MVSNILGALTIWLTLGVLIAERLCSHVAQSDGAFTAAVHKLVAVDGMEFRCRDDLRQFFHICRFDINYVWYHS